jgi:cyclophilin family peptidyl-prolyl cis-trans isomerase
MDTRRSLLAGAAALAASAGAHATEVSVCTDRGQFVIELADEQAPKHVENFLRYVDMGFYSGTALHRVVRDFVVQGGGVDRELRPRGPTEPPVENESRNGLSNVRSTVAAARSQDPNSATSQFFVNLADNAQLDAGEDFGYTVFGRVKEGIGVLDEIGRLPTAGKGPFEQDVPDPLPTIHSIARLDAAAVAALPAEGREAALKAEITAAATGGDHAAALRRIDVYRAVCGAADAEISVLEAEAALATGNRRRARFVLEDYLAATADTDPMYERALTLYRATVPENEQTEPQRVESCDPPARPSVPDGSSATAEQMVASQGAVRDFVTSGELYLACLSEIIDDKEEDEALRNTAVVQHNRMVASMEQTATEFNEQLREFRAR